MSSSLGVLKTNRGLFLYREAQDQVTVTSHKQMKNHRDELLANKLPYNNILAIMKNKIKIVESKLKA